jgi:hypothetical protein
MSIYHILSKFPGFFPLGGTSGPYCGQTPVWRYFQIRHVTTPWQRMYFFSIFTIHNHDHLSHLVTSSYYVLICDVIFGIIMYDVIQKHHNVWHHYTVCDILLCDFMLWRHGVTSWCDVMVWRHAMVSLCMTSF